MSSQPQPPLKRSRTNQKNSNNMFDTYKPRDWGYQNPKHQITPEFVLGKSKKRIPEPRHNYFPSDPSIYSPLNNGWRRELKPAIYRSYILSQASTVPGAVIVEESKIQDDKTKEDRRKFVEQKNSELLEKLMNYDLNTDISELRKVEKKGKPLRAKTQENIKVVKKKEDKNEIKNENKKDENLDIKKDKTDNNENKVNKIKVNLILKSPKKRNLRNNKLGEIKNKK